MCKLSQKFVTRRATRPAEFRSKRGDSFAPKILSDRHPIGLTLSMLTDSPMLPPSFRRPLLYTHQTG